MIAWTTCLGCNWLSPCKWTQLAQVTIRWPTYGADIVRWMSSRPTTPKIPRCIHCVNGRRQNWDLAVANSWAAKPRCSGGQLTPPPLFVSYSDFDPHFSLPSADSAGQFCDVILDVIAECRYWFGLLAMDTLIAKRKQMFMAKFVQSDNVLTWWIKLTNAEFSLIANCVWKMTFNFGSILTSINSKTTQTSAWAILLAAAAAAVVVA